MTIICNSKEVQVLLYVWKWYFSTIQILEEKKKVNFYTSISNYWELRLTRMQKQVNEQEKAVDEIYVEIDFDRRYTVA